MLTEKRNLSSYAWRFVTEVRQFSRLAEPACFSPGYPGRIVSVNARCIEDVDLFELKVTRFDGRKLMPPGPLP
jgi:hypothetical protein